MQLLNFTTLEPFQHEMVLSWRNHSDIRKWMIQQKEISPQEHLNFIQSLKQRDDKWYFLVHDENCYLGVINLHRLTTSTAELGIYANPDLRGVGKILMTQLIDFAITLGVSKLIANVINHNVRACHLYQQFAFMETTKATLNEIKMTTLEKIL
ncbi:MAG: UDP-4-amino-4,6-dideoxy-N-acetyl-beta-L-altrosamine N-acetyltransferase [Pseudomonadota bacterium]